MRLENSTVLTGNIKMEFKEKSAVGGRSLLGSVATIAGVVLIIAIGVVLWHLPGWVFALYLFASVVTFILYAMDKSAAGKDGRRIPESTMHLLSLLGGWPGALVAQRLLKHKSTKASFQLMFWITVALNCAAFFLLFRRAAGNLLGF